MSFIEEMLAKKRQGLSASCPDGTKACDNDADSFSDFSDAIGTLTLNEDTRIYASAKEAITKSDETALPSEITFDDVRDEILEITKENTRSRSHSQVSQVNIWDIVLDDDIEAPLYETELYEAEQPITDAYEQSLNADETAQDIIPAPPAVTNSNKRKSDPAPSRAPTSERSDRAVVDLFNPDVPVVQPTRPKFPVGWVVVVDGPGRGTFFTLMSGMSQIGRGGDQTIQLNFGDEDISQDNHAVIAYDTERHEFLLGHGGRSKIVRLNDRLVLSTETLKNTDLIRIGETTLKLVVLCDVQFNWETDKTQEDGHEAIA